MVIMIGKRFALIGAILFGSLAAGGCASDPGESKHSSWLQDEPTRNRSKDDPAEPKMLPMTFFATGKLLESRGQYEQAAQKYQQAVAVNHQFLTAYNRLGLVLDRLGRYEAADEAFVRAIELAPDKAFLRNNLAFSYILQRRWADAEAELRNALQLQGNFPRAHINLGLALARQGKFTAALKAFESTLGKDEALYNLGTVFAGMGRYQDANELYRKALAVNPSLSAAETQLQRLIPHLAGPRPDEPRARITDTEIIDLGIVHADTVPSPGDAPAVMPTEQGTVQTVTVPVESTVVPEPQSQTAARPAPLQAAPVASEVPAAAAVKAVAISEPPAQPASQAERGIEPSASAVQSSVDGNVAIVSSSPPPQTTIKSTLDQAAQSRQIDAGMRSGQPDMFRFEREIPDYVGLSPARQREILEAAWPIIRIKVGQWSEEFRNRVALAMTPSPAPIRNIEHDRPDLQGVSPGMQRDILAAGYEMMKTALLRWSVGVFSQPNQPRIAAGSERPDEADILPLTGSVRNTAADVQKESGEDRNPRR
jgi:Flp pilus assembly protein TadD